MLNEPLHSRLLCLDPGKNTQLCQLQNYPKFHRYLQGHERASESRLVSNQNWNKITEGGNEKSLHNPIWRFCSFPRLETHKADNSFHVAASFLWLLFFVLSCEPNNHEVSKFGSFHLTTTRYGRQESNPGRLCDKQAFSLRDTENTLNTLFKTNLFSFDPSNIKVLSKHELTQWIESLN